MLPEILDQTVLAGNSVFNHPQEQAAEIGKEAEIQKQVSLFFQAVISFFYSDVQSQTKQVYSDRCLVLVKCAIIGLNSPGKSGLISDFLGMAMAMLVQDFVLFVIAISFLRQL